MLRCQVGGTAGECRRESRHLLANGRTRHHAKGRPEGPPLGQMKRVRNPGRTIVQDFVATLYSHAPMTV